MVAIWGKLTLTMLVFIVVLTILLGGVLSEGKKGSIQNRFHSFVVFLMNASCIIFVISILGTAISWIWF